MIELAHPLVRDCSKIGFILFFAGPQPGDFGNLYNYRFKNAGYTSHANQLDMRGWYRYGSLAGARIASSRRRS